MPNSPEEMEEYSAMLTTLMSEYPEYKEMTLEEIADDMDLGEGEPAPVDEELANAELVPEMPTLGAEGIPEEEEEEDALFI